MRQLISDNARRIFLKIESQLVRECVSEIKTTNGNLADAPRACKKGSSIYILYSGENIVLYVGETGESIKTRCFGDGSGAHKHKDWFNRVLYVKHYTKDSEEDLNEKERKFIEQAFSVHLDPIHYGKKS